MQLKDLKVGEKGCILRIGAKGSLYRQRLISMGLLPGTEFLLSRVAPLGDPVEIVVRGFSLSLRKNEASVIEIERVVE